MNCPNCNNPINEDYVKCPHCNFYFTSPQNPHPNKKAENEDVPNSFTKLFSLLCPIYGFILFWLWRNESPLKAKSCLKWSLPGLLLLLAFIVFLISSITLFFGFK